MSAPDLAAARAGLLSILRQFGAQPEGDMAALADVFGLEEAELRALVEEMIGAGEVERFAGALRAVGVAA